MTAISTVRDVTNRTAGGSLGDPRTAASSPSGPSGRPPTWASALLPGAAVALLLVAALAWDGGFHERHWMPIALFLLLAAAIQVATGGGARPRPPLLVAAGSLWALAAWSLLSLLWSDSPGDGWLMADRAILYAVLVTIVAIAPAPPAALRAVGYALVAALAAAAVALLVALHVDGETQYLAGRLSEPLGYRNATACLFAAGFWPLLCLAAARERHPLLRGAALGCALLCLGLALTTQSRGILLGLALGAIVALWIGPDRLRRAWLAAGAIAATAAAWDPLLAPWRAFDAGAGAVTASDIAAAAAALTALAVGGAVAGTALALVDRRVAPTGSAVATLRGLAAGGLAVLAFAAAIAGLAAVGDPIGYVGDRIAEFRDVDAAATGDTRFTSTGGQRSDLWRIALEEARSAPLTGVGAGSYRFDYYEQRRTDRNLEDPHSLALRLLAETGIVGLLALLGLVAAIAYGLATGLRRADPRRRGLAAGLAAAGAVVLGQAQVDWLWLIPALTGLGLAALALAVAQLDPPTTSPWPRRALPRAALALCLGLAAVSVTLPWLSDRSVRAARAQVAVDPEAALASARDAARLDPLAVTPRYLEASALETLGRTGAARRALREALDREPRSFVTHALLGDLEVRAGRVAAAGRHYRRALALNPNDVGLQELARRYR